MDVKMITNGSVLYGNIDVIAMYAGFQSSNKFFGSAPDTDLDGKWTMTNVYNSPLENLYFTFDTTLNTDGTSNGDNLGTPYATAGKTSVLTTLPTPVAAPTIDSVGFTFTGAIGGGAAGKVTMPTPKTVPGTRGEPRRTRQKGREKRARREKNNEKEEAFLGFRDFRCSPCFGAKHAVGAGA
jgi:hypothetical protein